MKKKVKRLKLRTTHYSHRYLTILLLDRFHINLFCPVAYVFATNLSILKWPTNNQSQLAILPSPLSLSLSLAYNKLEAGGIWTQGSSPLGSALSHEAVGLFGQMLGYVFPSHCIIIICYFIFLVAIKSHLKDEWNPFVCPPWLKFSWKVYNDLCRC